MSYDITLVPRRPGQDWDEALEASDDLEVEDRSELLRAWSRIEPRLRQVLTGEIHVMAGAPDSTDLTVAELTAMDTGIQVSLFPGQASVSFPYWEQDDPEDFHRQVTEAVRVVAEETGYAAYDPQTDAEFDGSFDDETGLAFTRQLREDRAASGQGHTVDRPSFRLAAPAGQDPAWSQAQPQRRPADSGRRRPVYSGRRRSPYSGRRRAATYLVVGALVTLGAVWMLTSGNGGPLSWVALAIGVFDLAVGAVSWRSVTRADPGT